MKEKQIKISVSTNPPPIDEMLDYVQKVSKTDVDFIHCDVMDGRFVPAKTFDHKSVEKIDLITEKPLDVHLMVKNPCCKIKKYAKVGADIITVHFESFRCKRCFVRCLQKIYKLGVKAGISFCPTTQVEDIKKYLPYCQHVLVMSVVPGKSGQKFIEESYDRVKQLKTIINEMGLDDITIEIDGGVNDTNIAKLSKLGVDMFVVGNHIYKQENLVKAVEELKKSGSKKN